MLQAFKKEFQKLGDSFMALSKSFEFDERPGMSLNYHSLVFQLRKGTTSKLSFLQSELAS